MISPRQPGAAQSSSEQRGAAQSSPEQPRATPEHFRGVCIAKIEIQYRFRLTEFHYRFRFRFSQVLLVPISIRFADRFSRFRCIAQPIPIFRFEGALACERTSQPQMLRRTYFSTSDVAPSNSIGTSRGQSKHVIGIQK